MAKWYQLSPKLIEASQIRMAYRAVIAGPIHIVLFATLMLNQPEMRAANNWLQILFAVVVTTTVSRVGLWLFSRRILALPNGRTVWRGIFGSLSVVLGIAWGLCEASTFHFYGNRMESFVVFSFCVGISAASVAAYSFDLAVNSLFQAVVTVPTILVLAIHGGRSFLTLAIGSGLNIVFLVAMAVSSHRNQVALLENQETIESQKGSLEAAHVELQSNHGLIRTMLESIEEAFLIFSLDGLCVSEGTARTRDFFGIDPKGQHIFDVLRIPQGERQSVESWFSLLKSDRFDFPDMAGRGPKLFASPDNRRTFDLHYQPMRNEKGELQAIVLTSVEVTRELEAQKAQQDAQERSEMILRVSENMTGFRAFLKQFEGFLEGLKGPVPENLVNLRRELHTLKGMAGIFGAGSLGREVFQAELELRKWEPDVGQPPASPPEEAYREIVRLLVSRFRSWRQQEMELFVQLGVFEEEKLVVSRRRLQEVKRELSGQALSTFLRTFDRLTASEFGEQLKDFTFHVQQVAAKLGKEAELMVAWEKEPVFTRPESYLEVSRAMVHLFNNSVDHGLEPPAERKAAGKPARGVIEVRYGWHHSGGKDWLRVLVADDGRGINVEKLRARQRRIDPAAESRPDLEIMQSIFDEGVSTHDEVTEVSGQGVGMGAVRAAVLKARGRISILKNDAQGTTFEILLPPPPGASGAQAKAGGSVPAFA